MGDARLRPVVAEMGLPFHLPFPSRTLQDAPRRSNADFVAAPALQDAPRRSKNEVYRFSRPVLIVLERGKGEGKCQWSPESGCVWPRLCPLDIKVVVRTGKSLSMRPFTI